MIFGFITNQLRTSYEGGICVVPLACWYVRSSAHFIHNAPSSPAAAPVRFAEDCRNQFENYRRGTRTLRDCSGGENKKKRLVFFTARVSYFRLLYVFFSFSNFRLPTSELCTVRFIFRTPVCFFLRVILISIFRIIARQTLTTYTRHTHCIHATHFGFCRLVHSMELSSVNCSPRDQIVPDTCNGSNWANEQLDFNWQMQVSRSIHKLNSYACYLITTTSTMNLN